MKFIHCADLHLNSKIDSVPTACSRILREEVFRAFERLCDYAKDNMITAVIISGDMFDTGRVSQKAFDRVFSAIESVNNVDFLYLSGNHDDDVIKTYEGVLPNNFKIFTNTWSSYRYDNVVICGIELSSANKDYIYDTLSLDKNDVNILAMHGQIVGYKSNEDAEVISLPKLKEKNIDYLALGHIHSYTSEKLDNRAVYSYSGCLNGRGFDETGRKGFVLLDVQDKNITSNFIDCTKYEFVEYEYDVSNKKDWFLMRNEIFSDLKSKYDDNSLIKVVLTGERLAETEIDANGLTSYLSEYFFFAKVYDKTTLKISLEEYEADKSVIGEFVRTVFAENLSIEERDKVLTVGFNALKGEM